MEPLIRTKFGLLSPALGVDQILISSVDSLAGCHTSRIGSKTRSSYRLLFRNFPYHLILLSAYEYNYLPYIYICIISIDMDFAIL